MSRNSLAVLALSLATGLGLAAPARADNALHGRFELTGIGATSKAGSADAFLGARSRAGLHGDFRLTWEPHWGRWDFSLHYVLRGASGRDVALSRSKAALLPAPPPATLFDLSETLTDSGNRRLTQRIDRLSLGYSTPHFVFRIGRQALTWGAGQVFHPMDLVDPFAPNAVDTEYKPGVDMIYTQILFDDGSDLQAVAAPRRAVAGGPVSGNASTFALHYHRSIGAFGLSLLAARDRGDWTAGLGLSGPLGGATWNAEIVPTREAAGATRVSGLLNISGATTLAGRNATYYAEYFHNGFGVPGSGAALDSLPSDLTARLTRGQIFTVSRNYLAAGGAWDWTPLLTLSPSLIVNLDDRSFYVSAESKWSLSDNSMLLIGLQAPVGPHGTEFGGLPVSGTTAPYSAEPTTAFLQFRRYF
ncbi:hypothetical protein U879_04025 [Defluviimonas sp. 20V17]|uniref:Porin n=1 Tax=Allgaiera indica TaxID=765699 RepID=A0AAN5A0W6_9RHOB|nr:hypothetical protein [Allgaiera indica]KDB04961.1 hypothetical protein U879_04025 [Defluviimonas sp. 20V17]GHE05400.1 hypothetical protein GCM10008024_35970 [Allgaiera indica]SDX72712.1 hypothetical protein SAMN05444006_12649 [Allgaiera indica]